MVVRDSVPAPGPASIFTVAATTGWPSSSALRRLLDVDFVPSEPTSWYSAHAPGGLAPK